ncbi:MAG: GxxExxY protein [Pirellulales bacterium]
MNDDKPFAEEGYALMGAAFEVHRELGGGLSEEIYQQSLEIELGLRAIPFHVKPELGVFYKGRRIRKRYLPDFIIHERVIVELKAIVKLTEEHEGQLMNYMRITRSPVGYLINFGPRDKVEWNRYLMSEYLND